MSKAKPAAEQAAPDAPATVKARVLTPCGWGQPDAVVSVTAEEAAAGLEAGELDADPAAVAYAESLAVDAGSDVSHAEILMVK